MRSGEGQQVPLVVLTARDATDDRVRGLYGGADDYVAKPFEMAELLVRLRAVLPWRGGTASPPLGNHLVTPGTRDARGTSSGR
jgi:two-component system OmpR family response regulator